MAGMTDLTVRPADVSTMERAWRPGLARTDAELEAIAATLRGTPGKPYVYSRHQTTRTAYRRCRRLATGAALPKALQPYAAHLKWWTFNDAAAGPTILVCWVA